MLCDGDSVSADIRRLPPNSRAFFGASKQSSKYIHRKIRCLWSECGQLSHVFYIYQYVTTYIKNCCECRFPRKRLFMLLSVQGFDPPQRALRFR
jgi:hypothetical protein